MPGPSGYLAHALGFKSRRVFLAGQRRAARITVVGHEQWKVRLATVCFYSTTSHYTDAPEDNLLGLTDKEALNEQEALGVATVERYLLEELDYPVALSVGLVQELHRCAFGHLYE